MGMRTAISTERKDSMSPLSCRCAFYMEQAQETVI